MKIEMKDISDILIEAKKELEMSKEELLHKLWDTQDIVHKAIEDIKEYKEMGYSKYDENEIEIELIDKILEKLGGENNR